MKHLLIILICFFEIKSLAQSRSEIRIDSLNLVLSTTKDDSIRYRLIEDLGYAWYNVKAEKSLVYFQEALDLARKLKKKTRIEQALINNALHQNLVGNAPKAISLFHEVLQMTEKEKSENYGTASVFLGIAYLNLGDLQNALLYTKIAFQLFEKTNREFKPINKRGLVGIPMVLGEIFLGMNQLDSAFVYAQLAYQRLMDKKNNVNGIPFVFEVPDLLGSIHEKLTHKELALAFYKEGLQNAEKFENAYCIQKGKMSLANFFDKNQQPDSVIKYASQALESAGNQLNYKTIQEAGLLLKKIYEKQQNPAQALHYYTLAMTAKDSLANSEKVKQIQVLTFKEETRQAELAQQQAKANQQRQENIQLLALAVGIISAFIAVMAVGSRRINIRMLEFLIILVLLLFFEFINLVLSPVIDKLTNHQPALMLLSLVAVAAVLSPLHNQLENWMKYKMTNQKKKRFNLE